MTNPTRILVPVDFSAASDAALSYAIVLAREAGAAVDLLHVWEPPPDVDGGSGSLGPLGAFSVTPGGQKMRDQLFRLAREGISARGCLESGDPARAILRRSGSGEYGLLVIGSHEASRRSWRSMAFHVVERVVRAARCPVLAFHGQPAPSALAEDLAVAKRRGGRAAPALRVVS